MAYMIGTFTAAVAGALPIPSEVKLVGTTGYADDGDGGAALYAESAGQPATPARFQDSLGRWFGLAAGQSITPEKFGAVAVGADATAALQAAMNFAGASGGTVELSRMYLVSSEIEVPVGVTVRGPRSSGLKRIDEARTTTTSATPAGTGSITFGVVSTAGFAVGQSVMLVSGSLYSPYDPYSHRNAVITAIAGNQITINPRSNFRAHAAGAVLQTASHGLILLGDNRLEGFTIDGNEAMQTEAVWRTTTELVIEGSDCTVEDVAIVNGASDLVLVAGSALAANPPPADYVLNSRFIGCDFDNGGNNGIHLSFTIGTLVEGCRFRRLNRRNSGINIEHQDGGVICSYNNKEVIVSGCDFEDMFDAVGAIDAKTVPDGDIFNHGFVVDGNRMHNCHRPLRVVNRGGEVVFSNNRVTADYPYPAGLPDSRLYLLGTSFAERARRVQITGNSFTNVRIQASHARDLTIDGNSFDLTAQTSAGTIHPIFLSGVSNAAVTGNVVRGGSYGIRLLNFGGAGDVTGLVIEGNVFVAQRWNAIRGDQDAPGPVEALIRGNWIANDVGSAIGADYRAIRFKPGMYADGNRIALAVGSAWDLAEAGAGPSRGANFVNGAIETPANVAEAAGTEVTLALADAGGYRRMTASGAVSVTVPAEASVPFPLGTQVTIEQAGTGRVTLVGAAGVSVNALGDGRTTQGRHAVARLVKHGANAWTAYGDLTFYLPALFAGGTKGLWYDVSNLASMFQDDAGTVPAAVDAPVGRILDQSGNNVHAVQATAAARPILRLADGRHYLEFNGTSHFLTLTGMSAAASPWTMTAALDPTPTTTSYLFDAQSGRLVFAPRETTADDFVSYTEGSSWRRGGPTAPGRQVLSWRLVESGSSIRRNGTAIATGLAYTNRPIGGAVALGRHHTNASFYFKGRLYGAAMIGRALGDSELAALEAWMAERAGL
ncbi:MAG: hypothetical protein ACK40O_01340 [Allosphingosinicella sp.]